MHACVCVYMYVCMRVCLTRVYLFPMFHVGVCADAVAEVLGFSGT